MGARSQLWICKSKRRRINQESLSNGSKKVSQECKQKSLCKTHLCSIKSSKARNWIRSDKVRKEAQRVSISRTLEKPRSRHKYSSAAQISITIMRFRRKHQQLKWPRKLSCFLRTRHWISGYSSRQRSKGIWKLVWAGATIKSSS